MMTELAITATLAMGMLLVILPGHIDLSVGSGLALLSGLATVLTARAGLSSGEQRRVGRFRSGRRWRWR